MPQYAPAINTVVLSGAITSNPKLLSGDKRDKPGEHWNYLKFLLTTGSKDFSRGPLVAVEVTVTYGAEFWHAMLRRGMPVCVTGELLTRVPKVVEDKRWLWPTGIVVRRKGGIVMLWPRPEQIRGVEPPQGSQQDGTWIYPE